MNELICIKEHKISMCKGEIEIVKKGDIVEYIQDYKIGGYHLYEVLHKYKNNYFDIFYNDEVGYPYDHKEFKKYFKTLKQIRLEKLEKLNKLNSL